MGFFLNILLKLNLRWLAYGGFIVLLIFWLVILLTKPRQSESELKLSKILFFCTGAFACVMTVIKVVAQYELWVSQPVAKFLLILPVDASVPKNWLLKLWPALTVMRGGYFIYYSTYHFFLPLLASLVCAAVFYWLFKFLKAYLAIGMHPAEAWFLVSGIVITGWPGLVVFIPLGFFLGLIFAAIRQWLFNDRLISLSWPFLLAAAITLVWGGNFILLFHLSKLAF